MSYLKNTPFSKIWKLKSLIIDKGREQSECSTINQKDK